MSGNQSYGVSLGTHHNQLGQEMTPVFNGQSPAATSENPLQPAQNTGHGHHEHVFHRSLKGFVVLAILWETAMVILFAIFSKYSPEADATATEAHEGGHTGPNPVTTSFYAFFQDVHVMIFIGFGFLMTFRKRYGYGAVGFTLLISAMVLQWHMLLHPFWEGVFEGAWHKFGLEIHLLLVSDFCAGAVMITFGGLLGKVSPLQLASLAWFEVILFALNERIGLTIGIADIGGTSVIHMFGAYFGMAATRVLSKKNQAGHPKNGASYTSDMFAMIGTVYLWMFWPSFNGAPAVTGTQQTRAVVNTLLSLTGACISAYTFSALLRHDHRFNMVDVQNATLAGGVIIGGCADLHVGGGWAILIGCGGGCVSVIGYVYITPFLERKLGFLDTCGINNLHGMPSILGSVIAAIYASAADYEEYGSDLEVIYYKRGPMGMDRSASKQAGMQLAFIAITLGISMAGGAICGAIVNLSLFRGPGNAFEDSDFWEVPEEEPALPTAGTGYVSMEATTAGKLAALEARLQVLEHTLQKERMQQ